MCDAVLLPAVEQLVVSLESARDVVGVEDCDTRRLCEAVTAHQQHIGPGDNQDRGGAKRSRRHWADRACGAEVRVRRQIGRKMRLYADRSHARSTASMRDAKGLVQIEMANIRPVVARPR